MSYHPPYQPDDGHGDVPYPPGSGTSPQPGSRSRSRQPVPHQPQVPYGTAQNWESPPSAPYNVPSSLSHRPQQYTSSQSQFYPPGQEPTYRRQPDLPPGATLDRGSGYDRTQFPQQPQPQPYDTAFATQTQYHQQDYRIPQQQYSAQYSQQHAQQAYPQRYPQQQQYSTQYSQQQAYPPPHSQEQQYSPQYLQQQNRTYYPGRVAAMEPQGGANYAAAGGSYPSGNYADDNYPSLPPPGSQAAEGLGSPIAGGGGGSGMGGGASVAVHIHRRRYGDDATGRGYDDGDEVEE